jgi:hypothetical protein
VDEEHGIYRDEVMDIGGLAESEDTPDPRILKGEDEEEQKRKRMTPDEGGARAAREAGIAAREHVDGWRGARGEAARETGRGRLVREPGLDEGYGSRRSGPVPAASGECRPAVGRVRHPAVPEVDAQRG